MALDPASFSGQVEPFRRELLAHCYRMSGSLHEAEDLLQETMLRAWKGFAAFEERSSLRTWLHRIATHVCLDALEKRQGRSLPEALGPAGDPRAPMIPRTEPVWLEPFPDHLLAEHAPSPEARYSAREAVALAFLTVLQALPARQRAALLLHDVLGWSAPECAEALQSTPQAVNSAVQRARQSLAERQSAEGPRELLAEHQALLASYLRAWEAADVPALVALLTEDALFSMPPFPTWLQGREAIGLSLGAMVLPPQRRGDFRLLPLQANGLPGFATYQRERPGEPFEPRSIQLLSLGTGRIAAVHAFLDPSLFARLALPGSLPAG